jgi:hypothetical protein
MKFWATASFLRKSQLQKVTRVNVYDLLQADIKIF